MSGDTGDDSAVVENVCGSDLLVQAGQGYGLGNRDQMSPTEAADLSFHAAFFVGAFEAGAAEEGVEPVVRSQSDEPAGLDPVPAAQDPGHGGFQVVVADQGRDPTEVPKGLKARTCPSRNAS